MLKYILWSLVLLSGINSSGQTKLIIIGTVHSETKKISADTLLGELKKIGPDLLLLELDNSLMNEQGELLKSFNSLEKDAALQLAKIQSVALRPFDYGDRNKYYQEHQTFKNEGLFFNTIDSCYQQNLFDATEHSLYANFLSLNQSLQAIEHGNMKDINSEATQQLIKNRQSAMYQGLLKICYSNALMKRHGQFWKEDGNFWDFRNHEMIANIIKYCDKYKNKKIVVLTGFYHKYYLTQELKKKEKGAGFQLLDYWEF